MKVHWKSIPLPIALWYYLYSLDLLTLSLKLSTCNCSTSCIPWRKEEHENPRRRKVLVGTGSGTTAHMVFKSFEIVMVLPSFTSLGGGKNPTKSSLYRRYFQIEILDNSKFFYTEDKIHIKLSLWWSPGEKLIQFYNPIYYPLSVLPQNQLSALVKWEPSQWFFWLGFIP